VLIRGAGAFAFAAARAFGRLAALFGAAVFRFGAVVFRFEEVRFALAARFVVDLRRDALFAVFLRAADFGLAEARRAEARPPVFFFFEEAREVFRPPPRPAFFAFFATFAPSSLPASAGPGSYNSGFVQASRGRREGSR
jgi:hypothetical protein